LFGGFIMAVLCPECDSPITIDGDEVEEGETIHCEECGMELEVVSAEPLEIAPVEEGYDDEEDAVAPDEDEE
jgi:alpha-aminoadipate/glutamate carrier protein LysW